MTAGRKRSAAWSSPRAPARSSGSPEWPGTVRASSWSRSSGSVDRRPARSAAPAATLSGGNQQKVVVAREFRHDLKLLVLDQPTRGLDVGSIEFIHKQVIARRDEGVAILLVSAELDEVLDLSDRVLVMFRGLVVGTFPAEE